jgi:DNA-binding response OmpR family regulator
LNLKLTGQGVEQREGGSQVSVDVPKDLHQERLIAIVEDDAGLATVFNDLFQFDGRWRCQILSDGQKAIDCLPDMGADLILLDVGLPNLDGASLYKMLQGHQKTRDTPIIVITGSYDWELHRMGLNAGLLLRKPFKIQELLVMVQALLPAEREG